MTLQRLEKVYIDWDDTYLLQTGEVVKAPLDDITEWVAGLSYSYGLGVLNNPDGFSPAFLNGSIQLISDLDFIPQELRVRPHLMRHEVDGELLMQCVASQPLNRQMRLVSPNQGLSGEQVRIQSPDSRKDYWLWNEAHKQLGVGLGQWQLFNALDLRGGLDITSSYSQFLADFMTFAGGYAYEDKYCRMNFKAARAMEGYNFAELIDPFELALFEMDISSKEGVVRNQAKSTILQTRSERVKLRDYTVGLDGGEYRAFYMETPPSQIAGNWAVTVTKPDPVPASLVVRIESRDGESLRFSLLNEADTRVEADVSVFANVYRLSERGAVNELNVYSSILYGNRPLDNFPDWGATGRPVSDELARLEVPLHIADIRMPAGYNNPDRLLFYDTGSWFRCRLTRDFAVDMMLGRKTVISGEILELKWDMIETPLARGAYKRASRFDDPNYRLGINFYLGGEEERRGNELILDGERLLLGGEPFYFEQRDFLTMDDDYLLLDNDQLYFAEVE